MPNETTSEKLTRINQVKQGIKSAFEETGIDFTNVEFTEYAEKAEEVATVYNGFVRGTPFEVTIPDNVHTIRTAMFYANTGLTKITFPNGNLTVNGMAFESCSNLKTIIFGSGIKTFYGQCFLNSGGTKYLEIGNLEDWCKSTFTSYPANPAFGGAVYYLNGVKITTLDIPEGITVVKTNTFINFYQNNCNEIILPSTLTSIESSFIETSNGYNLTVKATTPPTLPSGAMGLPGYSNNIYVPSGSVNAYKTATNWSVFAYMIKPIPQ